MICSSSSLLSFCFFSQAEDGIRDRNVTGVQTCALPIYEDWPTYTGHRNVPPAKFVHAGPGTRVGSAVDSIISPGVVVSGSHVSNSVLSPGVRLNSWSSVSDSVIMDEVSVGRHCQIHRAIIDKNVVIPPRTQIGLDEKA